MLQAIIIEDEKHSQATLNNLLNDYCTDIAVAGMASSVESAIDLIKKIEPDLVFLDIELHPGTGFDVIKAFDQINFEIIFTTAFEQYAIQAIKLSSLDYLLKPIAIDDLQQAVEKCKKKTNQTQYQQQMNLLLSELGQSNQEGRNICLATAEGIEFINEDDIVYCEANGSYTEFTFKDGHTLLVSKHLKEYENLLSPNQFMRVHNSFLINLREVQRLVKSEGGYIQMNNGSSINISPKKRDEFMERMKQRI